MTNYCIDIDGTICTNTDGNYEEAIPYKERIDLINNLHSEGNKITFFTARGTTTGINWRTLTEKQLHKWGVNYDELLFGKPEADKYIDDKAEDVFNWFN